MQSSAPKPKALCVFYSLSGQTTKLVRAFADGFAEAGGTVTVLRLHPAKKIPFPFPTMLMTAWMMFRTLFKVKDPVVESTPLSFDPDVVIVGGPTWSFNPSGPILAWLDHDGKWVLKGKPVIPLISCRSYWKLHWWELKKSILALGGKPEGPVVFTHPLKEPWRSIGVFLVLMGKNPEKMPLIKHHFPRYGHTHDQADEAKRLGAELACALASGQSRLERSVN
jgi:hypothetical protein